MKNSVVHRRTLVFDHDEVFLYISKNIFLVVFLNLELIEFVLIPDRKSFEKKKIIIFLLMYECLILNEKINVFPVQEQKDNCRRFLLSQLLSVISTEF